MVAWSAVRAARVEFQRPALKVAPRRIDHRARLTVDRRRRVGDERCLLAQVFLLSTISLSFARKLRGEGSQLSQPCALAQLPHLILRVSVVGRGPSAYRTRSKVACYDILFSSCGLAKLATRPAEPAGTPTSQVRVAGYSLRAIAVGAAGEPSRPSQPLRASFRELSP